MSVSLIKERENKVTISLKKRTTREIVSEVNLILDASPSMDFAYHSGKVQEIVERVFPIASKFTPKGSLGMYIFSSNYEKLPQVTIENYAGYVKREIINKNKINGGTNYAPVIRAVSEDYLHVGILERIKRFFGIIPTTKKLPMFNIFITDGSNSDERETEKLIVSTSSHGLFWQCVGVDSSKFPFLERLGALGGRFVDNANFFQVNDISNISDEELYDRLLKEFPTWLDIAFREGII
jgi:vWA found in TerF C terminus